MKEKELVPKRRFKEFQNTDAWEQRKLSEVMSDFIVPMRDKPKEFSGDIPWTRIEDIEGKYLNSSLSGQCVSEETIKKMNLKIIPKGSLIVSASATFGVVAVVTQDLITNQTFIGLVPEEDFNLDFLYTFFQSPTVQKKMKLESAGSTIFYISRQSFEDMKFLFPDYAEQQKVGEFFSDFDNLITLHQRKLEKTKALKSAYLAEMFPAEGEHVPKRRLAGFTGEWDIIKIGDLMDVTSVRRIHQSDWKNEGVRFLRARDIVSYSKNQRPRDILYISEDKYIEYSRVSGKVEQGDLLVTGVGTIGIPFLISNNKPIYFKDGNIIWFRNQNKVNNYFLYYSFTTKGIQNYIKTIAGIGTVGTYTIENGKQTSLYLPTIKEQQAIGEFFKKLDDSITNQQQKLAKLKAMKQAYLQEMFV